MTDHDRPLWANLPHSNEINALLDELRDLTDVEARAMDVARSAVRGAARRGAARAAVWGAARRGAAWGASRRGAVLGAAWRDAWESAPGSAQYAAGDTALALVVADLVGQYGLTRDHLNVLTAPARTIPRLSVIIDRALPEGES